MSRATGIDATNGSHASARRLHDVRAQHHERPEAERHRELAQPAIDQLQRRRGVASADEEADDPDHQQRRRAVGRSRTSPTTPAARRRSSRARHLAQAHEAVLDHPRAARELRGRDVRVVGARIVSKTSFATFRPRWTKQAPMIVSSAATRSNRRDAAIEDAQRDRHERRGQERQAGRAQRQETEREPRLDRRPRSTDSASKYCATCRRTAPSTRRTGRRPRPSPRLSGRRR